MLIVKEKRALIFKLREPGRITTVIPTSKIIHHKGYPLVAVPHRPDEVRVLRTLGFKDIPDPVPMHYPFPGRFRPFKQQIETASFMSMHDRCYVLNSMGTGKTISTLWAYDYLRSIKQVTRALIICPMSTMEATWANEAFRTFPDRDVTVVYGSRERRLKLLAQPADVYIINIDGIKIIQNDLANRPDINLIVIDELAMARNSSTDRWKSLNIVCNRQTPRKVWGLTGAPTPHEPTDAWAQCRLINPTHPNVPKYFSHFKEQVMRPVTQYKSVAKDNAMDVVYSMMQPAIRFALDDCVDLPEQTFVTREVPMTPEQTKAYNTMLNQLRSEYKGGEIRAVNEAVKLGKLVQISLGVAYGADHEAIYIPSKPRMDVLKEIIEESEGKVLVFVPLTGALEYVAKEIAADGWSVATVHGGTSKTRRDDTFTSFQNAADPHVLVANPGTMSHGLTLTAATTIVWFGPVNSNDTYIQACARVRRPGQKRTTVIVHLVGSEIEKRIFARLQGKQRMQNVLLEMMEEAYIDD